MQPLDYVSLVIAIVVLPVISDVPRPEGQAFAGKLKESNPLGTDQNKSGRAPKQFLVSLSAHWIRGALYIIAILVAWYFLQPIIPAVMKLTGNRSAIVAFVLFAAFGPLVIGWLGATVVSPVVRKLFHIGGTGKWEERMVRELAPDSQRGFPVVLVPWPSATVRTFALLTDTYEQSEAGGALASVFIPGTPDPSSGFLRVVPVDELVYTAWGMKDLLRYHATYGATGPKLFADPGDEPGTQ
ncbi:MAG: hypothetical protein ACN4GT_11040 [Gammaproteobacteria bacterium]